MDKKQIEFLRNIYNGPMPVSQLRAKCNIDVDTYHREYRSVEMGQCFDVLDLSVDSDYEGTAYITPKVAKSLNYMTEIFAMKNVPKKLSNNPNRPIACLSLQPQ